MMARVRGHQTYVDWLGSPVLTLADLLPVSPVAICVGINPAPKSVEVGHYYQGALGQRFFARLRECEFLGPTDGGFEDDSALLRGIGFTDIVKRPTARATELTPTELRAGVKLLEAKLSMAKPRLVVFTFKKTAKILFGPFAGSGFVPGLTVAACPSFVMPPPYAPASESAVILSRLREWIRGSGRT
jgi:TDG/mug DNA glycosylase family protein